MGTTTVDTAAFDALCADILAKDSEIQRLKDAAVRQRQLLSWSKRALFFLHTVKDDSLYGKHASLLIDDVPVIVDQPEQTHLSLAY